MKKTIKFLPSGQNRFDVTINIDKLKLLETILQERYKTQVGVLGSSVERQQMLRVEHGKRKMAWTGAAASETNAQIGVLHEFGSITRNIPPRSFLRMPLTLKLFDEIKTMPNRLANMLYVGNIRGFYDLIGIAAENVVQDAFDDHGPGWKALSPVTIAEKGSSSQLIDSGQLRKSITSRVVKV